MVDSVKSLLYYDSFFADMSAGYDWDFGSIIRIICIWITRFFSWILNILQGVVETAWDFLQYTSFMPKNVTPKGNQIAKDANSTDAASLFNQMSKWIWIPIVIALVIFFVKFFFDDRKSDNAKRLAFNIASIFVVTSVLPTILFTVNTQIFGTSKTSNILSINSNATVSKLFWGNTIDYKYIYDEYVADILDDVKKQQGTSSDNDGLLVNKLNQETKDSILRLMKKNKYGDRQFSATTDKDGYTVIERINKNAFIAGEDDENNENEGAYYFLRYVNVLDSIDINEQIPREEGDHKFFNDRNQLGIIWAKDVIKETLIHPTPGINDGYKKAIKYLENGNTDKYNDLISELLMSFETAADNASGQKKLEAIPSIVFLNTEYFRYNTSFIPLWIEILANIYLYFACAYAMVKVIWEIAINRIFAGIIVAVDLTGGQKINRLFNQLVGLYVSLMMIAFTLVLYNDGMKFIQTVSDSDLVKAILSFILASVAVDSPNIIAKYFGVETGVRGGTQMLLRGLKNSVLYARMARMNRGRKSHGSPDSGAGQRDALSRMMHPLRTAREAVSSRAHSGVQNVADTIKESRAANKAHKAATSNYSKKNNIGEYREAIRKKEGHLTNSKVDKAAHNLFFNDKKDEIFKKAHEAQLKNPNLSNIDALQQQMMEKGGKENLSDEVAKANIGKYEKYKMDTANSAAQEAEARTVNASPRSKDGVDYAAGRGFKAYEEAAARKLPPDAAPEAVQALAGAAYGVNIRKSAEVTAQTAERYDGLDREDKAHRAQRLAHIRIAQTKGLSDIAKKHAMEASNRTPINYQKAKGTDAFNN